MTNTELAKNLVRTAWGIVALCFVSVLGMCSRAEAQVDVGQIMIGLVGSHVYIRDTRTIFLWRATTGNVTECWVIYSPKTLATLNQIGFEVTDFTYTRIGVGQSLGEKLCYATKL